MRDVDGKQNKDENLGNCEGKGYLTLKASSEASRNMICDFVTEKNKGM